jgi:hypothetical protein
MNSGGVTYMEAVEDHFRKARGTGSFVLSPRDWALVEAWEKGNIPLEAVFRGIDAAFEKRRRRPAVDRLDMVNSIAYCAQAIAEEATHMIQAATPSSKTSAPPFPIEDVRAFFARNTMALRDAGDYGSASALESLDVDGLYWDLEELEHELTAIEEKMIARIRISATEEQLAEIRQALVRELKPYRNKMTADQIANLETKFLQRQLLEAAGLPRLSLFYL